MPASTPLTLHQRVVQVCLVLFAAIAIAIGGGALQMVVGHLGC